MNIVSKNATDLSGQRFARWTVKSRNAERSGNNFKGKAYWNCVCDCGTERSVIAKTLLNGDSTSCGCLSRERREARIPKIEGMQFGRWTVLERDKSSKGGSRFFCVCECGNRKSVPSRNLVNGESQSCGCLHSEMTSQRFVKDLTGMRFDRWFVKSRGQSLKENDTSAWWNCICKCGTEKSVDGWSLRSGLSKSCGCLHREIIGANSTKHNGAHSRLYSVWQGMMDRCSNPNRKGYKHYGGRGICVCPEWEDFSIFQEWALKNGYKDDLTIDRKDVNKGYSPSNCHFIPPSEQWRNRRNTVYVTAWEETKTLIDWLNDDRCKVKSYNSLSTRMRKGIKPEIAMTKLSVHPKRKRLAK